jgi:excisionase family DNA binding protein
MSSERGRLAALFGPDVLEALDAFIAERVAAELGNVVGRDSSPWLSLRAAAEYVCVSQRSVERAVAEGRLRSSTIGRRRVIHRSDLNAFVKAAREE